MSGFARRGALIALAAVLAIAMRVPWFGGPYSRDEAGAMTVAGEVLRGNLPTATVWQGRQPGTYLFYTPAAALPLSPDAQLDVLGAVLAAAAAGAVAWWLSQLCAWPYALFGSAVYALSSADLSLQGQTANTELIINPLLTVAMVLITGADDRRRRHYFLAGLCAGVAGTVKEHVAVFVVIVGLVLFATAWERNRDRGGPALFFLGAALPWLGIALVYAAVGRFQIVYQSLAFTAGHAVVKLKDLVPGPLLLARNAPALYGTWPVWFLALGAVAAKAVGARIDRLVIAYFAAAVAMVILPGYYFAHYYLLALPPVVASAAMFVESLSLRSRRLAAAAAVGAVAYVLIVQISFMTGRVPLEVRTVAVVNDETVRQRQFAFELGRKLPGRTMLIYGSDHQFFLYSGLRPAQRALWLDVYDGTRFRWKDPKARYFLDAVREGLRDDPPDLILLQKEVSATDVRPVAREISAMLVRDYERVAPSEIAPRTPFRESDLGLTGIFLRR